MSYQLDHLILKMLLYELHFLLYISLLHNIQKSILDISLQILDVCAGSEGHVY